MEKYANTKGAMDLHKEPPGMKSHEKKESGKDAGRTERAEREKCVASEKPKKIDP